MHHSIDRRTFLSAVGGMGGILFSFPSSLVLAQNATPFPPFASPAALPAIDARPDGPLNVVTQSGPNSNSHPQKISKTTVYVLSSF